MEGGSVWWEPQPQEEHSHLLSLWFCRVGVEDVPCQLLPALQSLISALAKLSQEPSDKGEEPWKHSLQVKGRNRSGSYESSKK